MRQKYKRVAVEIIATTKCQKTPIVITEDELLCVAKKHGITLEYRSGLIRHLNMCGIIIATPKEKEAYSGNFDTKEIKAFLEELSIRLTACGLSDRSVSTFVSLYRMELTLGLCPEIKFENNTIPSENCFKTLSEAQCILKRFSAKRNLENIPPLEIHAYLKQPYEKVERTKSAIQIHTGWTAQELDELFSAPEWLLIDEASVHQFFAWLKDNYTDKLPAKIYKKAALIGIEETQRRIHEITDLLGPDKCYELIQLEANRYGWLFYGYKTDPVDCVKFLLEEKGFSAEKVLEILNNEPDLFYHYNKSNFRKHYGQEAFNRMINKYM